jgi:hypothetical protein
VHVRDDAADRATLADGGERAPRLAVELLEQELLDALVRRPRLEQRRGRIEGRLAAPLARRSGCERLRGRLASALATFFAAFFAGLCWASDGSAPALPLRSDCCSFFLLATVSMSSRARRTRVARGAET